MVVNLNGGTTTQHFESVYQGGTQITLVDPTKNKNVFSHWSTTGGILSGKNFTIGSTNTTLTANWLVITQLAVNLKAKSAIIILTQRIIRMVLYLCVKDI